MLIPLGCAISTDMPNLCFLWRPTASSSSRRAQPEGNSTKQRESGGLVGCFLLTGQWRSNLKPEVPAFPSEVLAGSASITIELVQLANRRQTNNHPPPPPPPPAAERSWQVEVHPDSLLSTLRHGPLPPSVSSSLPSPLLSSTPSISSPNGSKEIGSLPSMMLLKSSNLHNTRVHFNICIPTRLADIMLPCRKETEAETTATVEHLSVGVNRNLNFPVAGLYNGRLWTIPRRGLGEDGVDAGAGNSTDKCTAEGKVSLVSQEGIHQLHIFFFVLAVMQIVYSVLTMALGRLKMRRWKAWEKETQTTEYQAANDPNRFRFTRQTTFGRRHMTHYAIQRSLWIAHLSGMHNNFNFQKYIQRSLEEDFKVIVSISPLLWLIVVIFMLVFGQGWHVYLFISFIPLLIVLVLGTKLEVIVARMALQLNNQDNVIIGAPLVQPHDDLFWFGRPRFVLTLLHLTLFLNAFELAFFVWVTIQFGFNSCYHEHTGIIVTRVVLAVAVQVLCSYITLPLYALVTQMGSEFKSKVLEEKIANIIKQWHAEVRVKRKKQEQCSLLTSPRTSLSTPDWSLRNSLTDFSSHHHHRPTSTTPIPTDQTNRNNFSNRGEITEEKVDTPDDHRTPNSTWLPYQAGVVELPTVRQDKGN
ncbi:MLO-like protein 3 [Camellia lanceoleosa]|nr:MLO-like protein 3 [Camellia lanceoleosa]